MKTLALSILLGLTTGCNTNKENKETIANQQNTILMKESKANINDKEIMYGIALNMYTPFELYVNDIPNGRIWIYSLSFCFKNQTEAAY